MRVLIAGLATALFFLCSVGAASAEPLTLTAISGGYDDTGGSTAQLIVGGTDYSPSTRGMNLVVVDPDFGTVLDQASFDTYASTTAADSMATFIDNVDAGDIVLAAAKDEASNSMTSSAIASLMTLGVQSYPLTFRSSWAIIGVKDSLAGTAIEASAARFLGPSSVTTTINTVPEPSTMLLLGSGLIVLAGCLARRKGCRTR